VIRRAGKGHQRERLSHAVFAEGKPVSNRSDLPFQNASNDVFGHAR
jgi:hypothetical protein